MKKQLQRAKKTAFIISMLLTIFLLPALVGAAEHIKPPPPLFPGEDVSDFRNYIIQFYKFAIPASVLVATVMIMIGGVIWITSAGDQTRVSKAKEFIIQPIIGVVILMGAYVMLAYINPALVELELPAMKDLVAGSGACRNSITPPTGTSATCLNKCQVTTKADCIGSIDEGKSCEEACKPGQKAPPPDIASVLAISDDIPCKEAKGSIPQTDQLSLARTACSNACARSNCSWVPPTSKDDEALPVFDFCQCQEPVCLSPSDSSLLEGTPSDNQLDCDMACWKNSNVQTINRRCEGTLRVEATAGNLQLARCISCSLKSYTAPRPPPPAPEPVDCTKGPTRQATDDGQPFVSPIDQARTDSLLNSAISSCNSYCTSECNSEVLFGSVTPDASAEEYIVFCQCSEK